MTKTKLQIMREKKGFTRLELASNICDFNGWDLIRDDIKSEIYEYEKGLGKLSKINLSFISQILGCSVEELVEE